MQVLDQIATFCLLCKTTKKWGLYFSFPSRANIGFDEELSAAPYLEPDWGLTDLSRQKVENNNKIQCLLEGGGIILCDSEKEMERLYYLTVGDDGPTKYNSYSGPVRAYALTCDPNGQTLNENT